VYSPLTRQALHVLLDPRGGVLVGPPPAGESYLLISVDIAAATDDGCQACTPATASFLAEEPRRSFAAFTYNNLVLYSAARPLECTMGTRSPARQRLRPPMFHGPRPRARPRYGGARPLPTSSATRASQTAPGRCQCGCGSSSPRTRSKRLLRHRACGSRGVPSRRLDALRLKFRSPERSSVLDPCSATSTATCSLLFEH